MGGLLLILGIIVVVVGNLINYIPYESYENGYYSYFNAVWTFGILPIFCGLMILIFLYLPSQLAE